MPAWCRPRCQRDAAADICPAGDGRTSRAGLGLWIRVSPCANYRMWNVFVSFGLWLHLFVLLVASQESGIIFVDLEKVCKRVCASRIFLSFFSLFFFYTKLVFKKWNMNLMVRFALTSEWKQLLYNRTMHSTATSLPFKPASSGFPPHSASTLTTTSLRSAHQLWWAELFACVCCSQSLLLWMEE